VREEKARKKAREGEGEALKSGSRVSVCVKGEAKER
jgi:hypothetical protein